MAKYFCTVWTGLITYDPRFLLNLLLKSKIPGHTRHCSKICNQLSMASCSVGRSINTLDIFLVVGHFSYRLFKESIRIVPESPRWLFTQRRYEEADRVFQRAAKCNRMTIPEKWWEDIIEDDSTTNVSEVNYFEPQILN